MAEILRDTPVKLARCPRCGAYVFLAESCGLRAAADPAPADRDAYIRALVAGLRTFDLLEASGRPHKLLARSLGAPAPSFDPNGAQTAAEGRRKVLAEHGCGAEAKSMQPVAVAEAGPPSAPVTRGGHWGGPRPATAPAAAPTPSCPAGHASHRPFRCGICDRLVKPGDSFWGIEHPPGIFVYAEHEECP